MKRVVVTGAAFGRVMEKLGPSVYLDLRLTTALCNRPFFVTSTCTYEEVLWLYRFELGQIHFVFLRGTSWPLLFNQNIRFNVAFSGFSFRYSESNSCVFLVLVFQHLVCRHRGLHQSGVPVHGARAGHDSQRTLRSVWQVSIGETHRSTKSNYSGTLITQKCCSTRRTDINSSIDFSVDDAKPSSVSSWQH